MSDPTPDLWTGGPSQGGVHGRPPTPGPDQDQEAGLVWRPGPRSSCRRSRHPASMSPPTGFLAHADRSRERAVRPFRPAAVPPPTLSSKSWGDYRRASSTSLRLAKSAHVRVDRQADGQGGEGLPLAHVSGRMVNIERRRARPLTFSHAPAQLLPLVAAQPRNCRLSFRWTANVTVGRREMQVVRSTWRRAGGADPQGWSHGSTFLSARRSPVGSVDDGAWPSGQVVGISRRRRQDGPPRGLLGSAPTAPDVAPPARREGADSRCLDGLCRMPPALSPLRAGAFPAELRS